MADPTRSYDDRQIEAVLVQCRQCQRRFYMTRPRLTCVVCLDRAERARRCQEQETQ